MAHQHENTKRFEEGGVDKSRGAIRFNKIPCIYSESGESLYETESKSATPRNIESGEGRGGLRRGPFPFSRSFRHTYSAWTIHDRKVEYPFVRLTVVENRISNTSPSCCFDDAKHPRSLDSLRHDLETNMIKLDFP